MLDREGDGPYMLDRERDELKRFLDEFAELIDYVLARPPRPGPYEHSHWFPVSTLESLRRAWRDEVRPKIDTIKESIDYESYEQRFADEGLTGAQLELKIAAWDSTRNLTWWQAALGWLRPVQGALKIADAILESIGKVVPGVGALEEFKKILEGSLDIGDGRGLVK